MHFPTTVLFIYVQVIKHSHSIGHVSETKQSNFYWIYLFAVKSKSSKIFMKILQTLKKKCNILLFFFKVFLKRHLEI